MYASMLKPLVGQTGIEGELRKFWLMFAALDLLAMGGLLLYNRYFAVDTPAATSAARKIMIVVYMGLIVLGGWFLYDSTTTETIAYRALVQACIMLLIGAGGITISFRPGETRA
jgi:hypothetical protein